MSAALTGTFNGDTSAVEEIGNRGDDSYIPVLIELLRFNWLLDIETRGAIKSSLAKLAGEEAGAPDKQQRAWDWWVTWLGEHSEVRPPPAFAGFKGRLFATIVDPEMGAFLYDDVESRIRIEEIVWGGVKKDGILDLTDPPVRAAEDATYLYADDRVFGVSFNGEHRAYPLRILNAHEMANDVVGGVPFALAY